MTAYTMNGDKEKSWSPALTDNTAKPVAFSKNGRMLSGSGVRKAVAPLGQGQFPGVRPIIQYARKQVDGLFASNSDDLGGFINFISNVEEP